MPARVARVPLLIPPRVSPIADGTAGRLVLAYAAQMPAARQDAGSSRRPHLNDAWLARALRDSPYLEGRWTEGIP